MASKLRRWSKDIYISALLGVLLYVTLTTCFHGLHNYLEEHTQVNLADNSGQLGGKKRKRWVYSIGNPVSSFLGGEIVTVQTCAAAAPTGSFHAHHILASLYAINLPSVFVIRISRHDCIFGE
ncbi:hypothetical protein Gotri_010535 [Gossypium trilobum]|uniref:Uncharacterized protein n=1 Tax=Gossypium trilobum TaxID=34281 RepID=A0A7J9EQV3_9ROSI|nr:hypothetical protein [Gossypium trilobum]